MIKKFSSFHTVLKSFNVKYEYNNVVIEEGQKFDTLKKIYRKAPFIRRRRERELIGYEKEFDPLVATMKELIATLSPSSIIPLKPSKNSQSDQKTSTTFTFGFWNCSGDNIILRIYESSGLNKQIVSINSSLS
jgi:hypothetical protein